MSLTMPVMPNLNDLILQIREVALQAGDVILDIYRSEFEIREKSDASPVTEADEAAERLIIPALRQLAPGIPIIAEEAAAAGQLDTIAGDYFWLVDPLDGTKEFIARRDEFTVNIALIERGKPVMGVVHAPALGSTYYGAGSGTAMAEIDGNAALPINVRQIPSDGATVVSSRSHGNEEKLNELTGKMKIAGHRTAGSSLKFCLVATGEADIYPRYGPTCEWDTAAGHAVLNAAGGSVKLLDGGDFMYGKSDIKFLNPQFIARGLDGP
jgi:3'(2'), 5'-bisphosphate nucleotidase